MIDIIFNISATDWSEIIRNYALGVAAILTAYVALSGLNSWKIQQEWNEKRKIAINALLAIDKLEKVIHVSLVNPFSDEQLKQLIPQSTKYEGEALAIAAALKTNIKKKSSELKTSTIEFEEALVPVSIIFDGNMNKTTRRITGWINVFLAELEQLYIVAEHPILNQESSQTYIETYQRQTFAPEEGLKILNHYALKLLIDLAEKIRSHKGVFSS